MIKEVEVTSDPYTLGLLYESGLPCNDSLTKGFCNSLH
jgi:hypothetical protein